MMRTVVSSCDDKFVPNVESLWVKEAERRLKEIREGKATCRPAEDVMRDAREKLRRKMTIFEA